VAVRQTWVQCLKSIALLRHLIYPNISSGKGSAGKHNHRRTHWDRKDKNVWYRFAFGRGRIGEPPPQELLAFDEQRPRPVRPPLSERVGFCLRLQLLTRVHSYATAV